MKGGQKVSQLKLCVITFLIAVITISFTACSGGYNSNEPCAHCKQTPTKGFRTSNGDICYVCEQDSTICWNCSGTHGKATHHLTNGYGDEIFFCDYCYENYYSE